MNRISRSMVSVLLASASIVTALPAYAGCMNIRGKLAPEATTENCASPVGICAKGDFTGLARTLNFTATAVTNTDLSPDTGVIVITGNSVHEVRGGTYNTEDTIVLNTSAGSQFSEVDIIKGGTGDFAGATGVLQIVGVFPPTGKGNADYHGQVCTPDSDDTASTGKEGAVEAVTD